MADSLAPFVPSPIEVVRRMLSLAEVDSKDVVYDLGCGDGRILTTAITEFNARKAIGYEIRTDLYLKILSTIQELKPVIPDIDSRIRVYNSDAMKADLSEATVVTLYLTTLGNEKLKPKFESELKPGARIVSHDFTIPGWTPVKIDRFQGHVIYLYIVPDSFKDQSLKARERVWRLF
ncbi:MAG: SAM-dependent methyltransferase [Candidatus Bathyarchaeia archaeon]|nr:SAM-dependent methyltransferase [Candidatus Bathyarchaeota archaeon]